LPEAASILDICRAGMWSSFKLCAIADASRNDAKLGRLWFADYAKMPEMPLPACSWGETEREFLLGVTF